MKKTISIIYISLFCMLAITAQERIEKIKTLKIAYLTEQLQLTPNEAEKFWPIYNVHENKTDTFFRNKMIAIRKEIRSAGGIDNLDEKRANVLFEMMQNLEHNKYKEDKKYVADLRKILSVKKIIKLQIAEREFGRELMKKYKRKRPNPRN